LTNDKLPQAKETGSGKPALFRAC